MATTTQQTPPQAQAPTYKYGPQCTHLTMTRIFTKEFRCCVCFQLGSFGWLYRCTQDRELMIEDDVDKGYLNTDDLGNVFERPPAPSKRGPIARRSKYSFFKEVSDEQLKTYSEEQVEIILEQRGHAIESAAGSTGSNSCAESIFGTLKDASSRVSMFKSSARRNQKPWIPIRGAECQFKCCHRCRHTYGERTWLSLDGIANNDVPWTAATGFGFHLMKSRPVSKVEHVKNLGLRPNPNPLTKQEVGKALMTAYIPPRAEVVGIFIEEEEGEDTNTTNSIPIFPPGLSVPADTTATTSTADLSDGSAYEPFVQIAFAQLVQPASSQILECTTPSPSPALRIKSPNIAESPPLTSPFPITSTFSSKNKSSSTLKLAIKTSLPSLAGEDMELEDLKDVEARRPLTPMEKDEAEEGVFGKMPLEVGDGVAVMEEGVEGHWADLKAGGGQEGLITQF